jgi:hypothetical protein
VLTSAWSVIVPPSPGVLCALGDATTRAACLRHGPPVEELLERCEAETGLPVPTRSRWDAERLGQEALQAVERRVLWLWLWLSTVIIDQANRVRRNPEGFKVGVHQAPAHPWRRS